MIKKPRVFGCKIDSVNSINLTLDRIEEYKQSHNIFIQVFDADMILGSKHLLWAYDKSLRCFEKGTNSADFLEIETILWSSGERQIKDALIKMGIKNDTDKVAVLLDYEMDIKDFLEHMCWERNDDVLKPSKEKLIKNGISDKEMDSVENPMDLIFEKMSVSSI
ncbi:MAG: KEOPS complex subunit Cgi121 [Candidatus Saliniplasma sp.]